MTRGRFCEICGDESAVLPVCDDCLREAEFAPTADAWQLLYHNGIEDEALGRLEETPLLKCELCGQYYGPYSMERHLENDHALRDRTLDYERGYSDGRATGEQDGFKKGRWAAGED